jgi:phage shock protein PspC (stress-responsive transcriptional regulator)
MKCKKGKVIDGVCQGIAKALGINTNLIRILWLLLLFFWGMGLIFYIILSISLPSEDRLNCYFRPQISGVCLNLSRRFGLDLSLIRTSALILLLCSGGVAAVIYLGLHYFPIESLKYTSPDS